MPSPAAWGITHLALCDHDTVDGLDAMARAVREENRARASRGQPLLTLIPGVEISTGPGGRTHLLAYGASGRNAPLAAFLAGVSAERRMRAGRILDRLAEAGLTVTPKMRALPDIPSVGRAHFARALVESGQARDVHQAFDRYLSEGRPGYVPRASFPPGDTVAALSGMGLVVVLAHPMRLELERETLYALIREWKARGLRGVEAYHPSAGRRGARLLDALAREEGLLVTGGSDYHGRRRHTRPHGPPALRLAYLGARHSRADGGGGSGRADRPLAKGAAGCITRDTVPSRGRQRAAITMRKATGMCPRPGQAQPVQPQKRRASPPPRGPQPPRTPRDGPAERARGRARNAASNGSSSRLLLVLILLAGAGVYGYIWKIQSDVRPYLNVFFGQRERGWHRPLRPDLGGGEPAGLGPCEPEAKWLVCAPAQHQRAVQGHHRSDAGHLL